MGSDQVEGDVDQSDMYAFHCQMIELSIENRVKRQRVEHVIDVTESQNPQMAKITGYLEKPGLVKGKIDPKHKTTCFPRLGWGGIAI